MSGHFHSMRFLAIDGYGYRLQLLGPLLSRGKTAGKWGPRTSLRQQRGLWLMGLRENVMMVVYLDASQQRARCV
jgi:hypothetical protein